MVSFNLSLIIEDIEIFQENIAKIEKEKPLIDEEDRGIEEIQEGIREDVDVRSFNSKFITPEKSSNFNKEKGSPKSNEINNARGLSSLNIRNPFNQADFKRKQDWTTFKHDAIIDIVHEENKESTPKLRRSARLQNKKQNKMITRKGKKEIEEKKENRDEVHIPKSVIKQLESFIITKESNKVSMMSIIGYNDVKQKLKASFVYRILNPSLFANRKPIKSLLLYGPPWNGKTLFVQALATEMKRDLISVKTGDLLSKWQDFQENIVDCLFRLALVHEPWVIFFDEIDSLFLFRDLNKDGLSSKLVYAFNQYVGGVKNIFTKDIILVGATNQYDKLDSSIIRRFDEQIMIESPSRDTISELISKQLVGVKGDIKDDEYQQILDLLKEFCITDIIKICDIVANQPYYELTSQQVKTFKYEDIRAITFTDFKNAIDEITHSLNLI